MFPDLLMCFNPRAPCGARPRSPVPVAHSSWFQSTRPMRGATYGECSRRAALHVSIHAPRAGRDLSSCPLIGGVGRVSIHAPRAGRDTSYCSSWVPFLRFNPRAPCGAQPVPTFLAQLRGFNPRAPCGARRHSTSKSSPQRGFNPRAPCGARQTIEADIAVKCEFQSTRPVWGATTSKLRPRVVPSFQSTRPVWGATSGQIFA